MTAWLCVPGMALILLTGLLSGEMVAATIAAGGALSVGFGAFKRFERSTVAPMALAAAGMAVATYIGSLAGHSDVASLVLVVGAAAACALLATIEINAWWIVLQWAIALMAAGAFPGDAESAAIRAGLVLAGGCLQVAVVALAHHLRPTLHDTSRMDDVWRLRKSWDLARHGRLPTLHHGLRTAIAVGLTMAIAQTWGEPHGYWAPITALLVLRPKLSDTRHRDWQRLLGTVIGSVLASLVAFLPLPLGVLALLTLVLAWLSWAYQGASYVVFTAFITAATVLLIALNQVSEVQSAVERVLATVIGGTIALGVAWLTTPRRGLGRSA